MANRCMSEASKSLWKISSLQAAESASASKPVLSSSSLVFDVWRRFQEALLPGLDVDRGTSVAGFCSQVRGPEGFAMGQESSTSWSLHVGIEGFATVVGQESSASWTLHAGTPNNDLASGPLDARPPPALSDTSSDPSEFNRLSHGSTIRSLI